MASNSKKIIHVTSENILSTESISDFTVYLGGKLQNVFRIVPEKVIIPNSFYNVDANHNELKLHLGDDIFYEGDLPLPRYTSNSPTEPLRDIALLMDTALKAVDANLSVTLTGTNRLEIVHSTVDTFIGFGSIPAKTREILGIDERTGDFTTYTATHPINLNYPENHHGLTFQFIVGTSETPPVPISLPTPVLTETQIFLAIVAITNSERGLTFNAGVIEIQNDSGLLIVGTNAESSANVWLGFDSGQTSAPDTALTATSPYNATNGELQRLNRHFKLTAPPKQEYSVILPVGTYKTSVSSPPVNNVIQTELQNAIQAQTLDSKFTVAFSELTGKISITHTASDIHIKNGSINSILGFKGDEKSVVVGTNNVLTASNFIDLRGVTSVYIHIDSIQGHFLTEARKGIEVKLKEDVLLNVPMNKPFGSTVFYENQEDELISVNFRNHADLSAFRVYLTDKDNVLVNTNGLNWSMNIVAYHDDEQMGLL